MDSPTGEVTLLLAKVRGGSPDAANQLVPLVYAELRRMAGAYMRSERPNHSMQATELVHEAYMRMVGATPANPENRAHFFAIAANTMRQVLLDYARKRSAGKRGGPALRKIDLNAELFVAHDSLDDVIIIDELLNRLNGIDPRQSRLIELRFFAGLSSEEAGEVMGVSEATVKREWRSAKAWLHRELEASRPPI